MPKIHNPDWNSLKLSDFPNFKCLCELCDCGCFERSKKKHTNKCKKFVTKISDAFESSLINPPPFETSTLYSDTFKKYDYVPSMSDFSRNSASSTSSFDKKSLQIPIPYKHGPRDDNIELPEKEVKASTHTTNKDHYKSWHSPPAKLIPEYPEFTSRLLYPNQKRALLTTNEELYHKNYGKYKAESTAMNIFENTFKISQGKMNLNTVYNNDFHKLNLKEFLKERGPIMTKEIVENKNKKVISKIPMETKTQKMVDYSYDPETFRSITQRNKEPYSIDLFRSKLSKGLNPKDNDFDSASLYESNNSFSFRDKNNDLLDESKRSHSTIPNPTFGESHLTHNKNIRFINTFDNRFVPSLKVMKTLTKRRRGTSSTGSVSSSVDFDYVEEETPSGTTYTVDYKDRGVDVCMAKAYSMVQNKMLIDPSNQNQSIVK